MNSGISFKRKVLRPKSEKYNWWSTPDTAFNFVPFRLTPELIRKRTSRAQKNVWEASF
jgi:hypothetical protein